MPHLEIGPFMTRAFRPAAPSDGYVIDCGRAVIQAYARSVATVLTVRGTVDALNADGVYRHLSRFGRLDTALIIDITEADIADLAEFRAFADDELSATIVAGPEDLSVLQLSGPVSVFDNVPEAVQLFVRGIAARRDPVTVPLLRLA
jgi:hypothetical protein